MSDSGSSTNDEVVIDDSGSDDHGDEEYGDEEYGDDDAADSDDADDGDADEDDGGEPEPGGGHTGDGFAAERRRILALGPDGREAERRLGAGAMELTSGKSAALAYAANHNSLLKQENARFIFAFEGPSTFGKTSKKRISQLLIHPHLADMAHVLSGIYRPYAYQIRTAGESGWASPPRVHSLRNGSWTELVPDHVELRRGNGRSTFFVVSLLENEVNLDMGKLRARLERL